MSETTRSRNPAGHAGLLENLLALLNALAEFFESRFALLAEESKARSCITAHTGGLRNFCAAPVRAGLRFSHHWRGCRAGAPHSEFHGHG